MRALVIDNSRLVRSFLRRALARLGFDIDEAEDGMHGWLSLHTAGPFSLVVAEAELPRLGGEQLLQRMRADLTYRQTRFLMLADAGSTQLSALLAGADACLAKPFGFDHLATTLRSFGWSVG